MIDTALTNLRGKRIVMLQGPVGPFFWRLRRDLEQLPATVFKINLNGGDWFFYPKNSYRFRQSIDEWPAYFGKFLQDFRVDVLVLFGDCRIYHKVAIEIARKRGIAIKVFEEGYVRPDYVTFETGGVNGFSPLPKDADYFRQYGYFDHEPPSAVGNTFWYAAGWAMLYYFASACFSPWFRQYCHHRPLRLLEGIYWIRALWRKLYRKFTERKMLAAILKRRPKKFFLVPLQTHNDHQVTVHSAYSCVEQFIRDVMVSFAVNAPHDAFLVIKHHPMDRAYRDYTRLVRRLCVENRLESRVLYVHDLHLPTLLKNASGVVAINSTAGLSALFHGTPVKVCGHAIYDLHGLTFQGDLDRFWAEAQEFRFDRGLYRNFRHYLVKHTQVNGSFYKKLAGSGFNSGVFWTTDGAKENPSAHADAELRSGFANSEVQ